MGRRLLALFLLLSGLRAFAQNDDLPASSLPAQFAGEQKDRPASPDSAPMLLVNPEDLRRFIDDYLESKKGDVAKEPISEEKRYPTFRLTGFFHLDDVYIIQETRNRLTVGNAGDGLMFRRARLATTGNLTDNITYIMEFDFAAFQPLFVDVWANFADIPILGNIRIGRWRQPFGMSELTSIRELPFLERSLTFALSPFRQTGIGAFDTALGERATWAISAYRFNTDFFGNVIGHSGGYGAAVRLTALPHFADESNLVHLGFDYSFNDPEDNAIRLFHTPEVFAADSPVGNTVVVEDSIPFFVDTGLVPTAFTNLFNVEAACVSGPFALQSEMRWLRVDQGQGNIRVIPAVYAYVRYILTGENQTYDKKAAVLTRIKPLRPVRLGGGGWGAWEVAARWSYIDLNGTLGDGPGRALNDLTFGINWYLNERSKFQFNYIHAFLNDPTLGPSNADIFALRFQMDF
ncbi:MAG: porin [Gemmatales bacterium]|nr:MAG: porin [Gemmatales bacterium]